MRSRLPAVDFPRQHQRFDVVLVHVLMALLSPQVHCAAHAAGKIDALTVLGIWWRWGHSSQLTQNYTDVSFVIQTLLLF